MWILSKNGYNILNTDNCSHIGISQDDGEYKIEKFYILADEHSIGEFQTKEDAKKELNQIYNALVSGQDSYSVG